MEVFQLTAEQAAERIRGTGFPEKYAGLPATVRTVWAESLGVDVEQLDGHLAAGADEGSRPA